MTLSVGVVYGVLGCLLLSGTNAQYDSYYNQDAYYRQYPQYTEAQANSYHGYTTPSGINMNSNSVQVIEVTIPDSLFTRFGNSKQTVESVSHALTQVLEKSQSPDASPYSFSIHTYSDNTAPQVNYHPIYAKRPGVNTQTQYIQASNYQQPSYYTQQEYLSHQNIKQQEYETELQQYNVKLEEYYNKYPWARPITPSPPPITESIKPNEIKPIKHEPIVNDSKSLADLLKDIQTTMSAPQQNKEPSDGKSLLELLNEKKGKTESGKTVSELLGHQSTEMPNKSLDDLIGNVFTEKHVKSTEKPMEDGKTLLELLAELPPPQEESPAQEKKNSDVAGGDYGLDVRTDDNKLKRTKRHILHDGFRRITERIANFGRSDNERHERNHECNHNEGRSYHSSHHNHNHHHHRDRYEENKFNENHDWHKDRHTYDNYDSELYPYNHHQRPHAYPNSHPHLHPHPNNNNNENNERLKPNHNDKSEATFSNDKPFDQGYNKINTPISKPHSVDAGTQTDTADTTRTEIENDPTIDIDVRGGFSETRKKRSSDEDLVFQDDDTPKVEEKKEQDGKMDANVEEIPTDSTEPGNSTESGGEDGEKGELDSRFGFFGGSGFRKDGRRPIANFINGVLGGFNGPFDLRNQQTGPYPYYPVKGHQQQPYYTGQPQQPVHIHINNVANAQSQATNTASGPFGFGSNQNAAANAQSQNFQNEFGSFQNSGASGQASNLGADGLSGQLSAANAMNQNYQNEFGFGSKNTAQSQSANFDQLGNLALTSSNSGTNHHVGPDGVYDETNSAAQSSLQNQFGSQNSGAQSNTFQGPHGSGASASSQASNFNNGFGLGSKNTGANAVANSGNVGGNSFGNAQSGSFANDQWGW